jgi:hypothetical protein
VCITTYPPILCEAGTLSVIVFSLDSSFGSTSP